MKSEITDYTLYHKFIKTFLPTGFKEIDPNHPVVQELEQMMVKNHQFFFIADVIEIKILFTSKLSIQMLGIQPAEVSPYHGIEATHPDDFERHNRGRAKLFKLANDLFRAKKGEALLVTDLRLRNANGDYTNLLFQCYLFYAGTPIRTVYYIQVHTDVDWYKKNKSGCHFYVGDDLSLFRYPDEELLRMGNIFSKREFEIIQLIESGLNSEKIAEKLFISVNTVNTHRRNILVKSGKANIADLIYELKEKGQL